MSYKIKEETINTLFDYQNKTGQALNWPFVFTLPVFLQTWWMVFGQGHELILRSVFRDEQLIGLAPLMRYGSTASFLGSPDVCDYLDFMIVSGKETEFFQALLPALEKEGIKQLELNGQRPEAAIFRGLFASEKNKEYHGLLYFTRENEAFEMNLPASWEGYLAGLSKKQRHEVRRKLRRLEKDSAGYHYRVIEEDGKVQEFIPSFFKLMQNNPDKADFFTAKMEQFFYALIDNLARAGLARFGLLEIDGITTAAVLYFDYQGRINLYNSGYISEYSFLSTGLLSKVLCIRHGIEQGRQVFDFLKGDEVYKKRLGGTAVPIYKVEVDIS